jgi:hypothetical protein
VTGASDQKPIVRLTCPQLVQYEKEFMQRAAEELQALKKDGAIARLIVDYSRQRDACRRLKKPVKD